MDDIIKGLHDKIKLLNINYKIIVFINVILKKIKRVNFKIYIITYTNKYSFIKKLTPARMRGSSSSINYLVLQKSCHKISDDFILEKIIISEKSCWQY